MARDDSLVGTRKFYLRRSPDVYGWVPVEVSAILSDDRAIVCMRGAEHGELADLQCMNPEVAELFELLGLESLLVTEPRVPEILGAREPVAHQCGASDLIGRVHASLDDVRLKVESFATDTADAFRDMLGTGASTEPGRTGDIAGRIRQEVETAVTRVIAEEVVHAWARRRLRELFPVLAVKKPYVAPPPGRGEWQVGSEVLDAMKGVGLSVTVSDPVPGKRAYDTHTIVISSPEGSHETQQDCPVDHPSPAVHWAYWVYLRHRGAEPSLDEAMASARRGNAFFFDKVDEAGVRAQAEEALAERRAQRAVLEGLMGVAGMAAAMAVEPGDDTRGTAGRG